MSARIRAALVLASLSAALSAGTPASAGELLGVHLDAPEAPEGNGAPVSCDGFEYQQPFDPGDFFAALHSDDGPPPQYLAEAFVDGAGQPTDFPGGHVGRARWWGLSISFDAVADCAESAAFVLVLRADSGGLPGAALASATVTPTAVDTGAGFGSFTIWQYDAALPTPLDATGASWIEIRRESGSDPDCSFQWLNEGSPAYDDDAAYSFDHLAWAPTEFGDLTVCLGTPPLQAIPAVGATGLMLLGVILLASGLLLLRRRRAA